MSGHPQVVPLNARLFINNPVLLGNLTTH